MNFSHQPRRASASWPHFLVGVVLVLVPALIVVAFLLEAEARDSGTTWRDCPAKHTSAGSYVPAGARPCVLRTGGHPGGGATGTNDSSNRDRDRQKQPGRLAPAVKPPAAKAPAAPAAKPPPVAVRK